MMPEFRKDPIQETWVIIASERKRRPSDFAPLPLPKSTGDFCPLCEGNEDKTPSEILALRDGTRPDSPGWSLRVVPNKFPALRMTGELGREGQGIYDRMNGIGVHEVVVETSQHAQTLADLPLKAVEKVLWAYRQRIIDLSRDRRLRYVLVFKNHGAVAGASLEHSHSQIIGLPIVPKRVSEEIEKSRRYFDDKERCIFCDILRQELQEKRRIISENESFALVAPFASRFPFETWVFPKDHSPCFEHMGDSAYEQAAQILSDSLRKMSRALHDPPFNYVIHTSSLPESEKDSYHWHLEVIPRLTKMAGFEWGTGYYINPMPPEDAAEFLRSEK